MVFVVEAGHSIQMAIDAAGPGDTVLVRGGVYRESLTVPAGKDRLRLLGAGPDETVLDGTGLAGATGVVIADASGVTLAGFTVRNFAACGIAVRSHDNVIRGNVVTENGEGGIAVGGLRNLLEENTVAHNGRSGIAVGPGGPQQLISNVVRRNAADGIAVAAEAACCLILENTAVENHGAGIAVASDGSWVIGNAVHDNDGAGMRIGPGRDVLVYGNTAAGNGGDGIEALGDGLVAVKNTIRSNAAHGMRVPDPAGSDGSRAVGAVIYDNTVGQNAACGLGCGPLRYALVLRNRIDGNGEAGIDLAGGDGNRVLANTVESNESTGIRVGGAVQESLVDDNRVHANRAAGIEVAAEVRNGTVRANKLRKNTPFDVATEATAVSRNVFDLNECENSSPTGICH